MRSLAAFLSVALIWGSAGCGSRSGTPVPPSAVLPQISGTIALEGLSAPVRVVRDRWGVPHIAAQNQDDLFFAQGFVQAQDRLFQMDLWRRSVQGRLSEVLGGNFIERDAMTRRVQFRGDINGEWASYGPDTQAIAGAFTRGINAWVSRARERLPEEFVLAGWAPEFWRPEDLLNRTDAFVASGNALDEVFRARLMAARGRRPGRRALSGRRRHIDRRSARPRSRGDQRRRERCAAAGWHTPVLHGFRRVGRQQRVGGRAQRPRRAAPCRRPASSAGKPTAALPRSP